MRADRAVGRWIGIALTLIGVAAIVHLAATGRLELYIHPRYTVFTVVMAVLGGLLAIAAILVPREGAGGSGAHAAHAEHGDVHEHEHDHDHEDQGVDAERPVRTRLTTAGRLGILVLALIALLVIPPATLSATARTDRELATSGQVLDAADAPELAGGDTTSFSVKDWAALIRQGGAESVLGQRAAVSGYLLDRGEEDVVYVVRMLVTCCAVDAQPLGFAIQLEDWQSDHAAGDWVEVSGVFVENPDIDSDTAVVLEPQELAAIEEPEQPYVF
ncbi:TIGR03943 family putative permease subunit [Homoserinibacter sp. YIM 151385]|uniref:TIGR03943 family putative permease subunit n=1 Tax=Homoserinibacter sp. YIM 151385 TaxID=2985506 RepID=UPI0022F0304D|nr:TIGR03943 family protein [Homoserinibacter sp. YIM 151385]WBU37941.1 TIGR03943 family protein [Homoserinibacter sp. YIM 151385]